MATETVPSCTQVLKACDQALKDKQVQIDIRDLGMHQSQDVIDKQFEVIKDQDSKLTAFYRNPFFLLGLGLVAGHFLLK